MKPCTDCAEEIEVGSKYCKHCGAKQDETLFLPSDEASYELLSKAAEPNRTSLYSKSASSKSGGSSNTRDEMTMPKTSSYEFNIRSFLLIGFAGQVSSSSLKEMVESTFPALAEARVRESGSPNESRTTANVLGFFPYKGAPRLTQFLERLEDQCSNLMQDYCNPSLYEDQISVQPFGGVAVVRIDHQLAWELSKSPELAQVMHTELEFWIDLEVLGKFQVLESSYGYDEPKICSESGKRQPLRGNQQMSFKVMGAMDWGTDAEARNEDDAKSLAVEEINSIFDVVCVDDELDPQDWTAYEWEFHQISNVSSHRTLLFGRTGNFVVEGYSGFSVEIETEGSDFVSCSNKAREVFTRFWKIRNLDLDELLDFEIRSIEVVS